MRTFAQFMLALGVGLVIGLAAIVLHNAAAPDCEALYNEYTSTVDMDARQALFDNGIESGCFHYN